MAFKGSYDTQDGTTHANAIAVIARMDLNYEEGMCYIKLNLYHSQNAYDANKRIIAVKEYTWSGTTTPTFGAVFNANAMQLALKDLKGDLAEFVYNLVATVDPQLAGWVRVADSKPVKAAAVP